MDKTKIALIVILAALCVLLVGVLANHFIHQDSVLPPVEVEGEQNKPAVTSATMTTGIDADGAPEGGVAQYGTDDPFIASCTLDTQESVPVTFVWLTGGKEFHREDAESKNGYAHDELQSEHTWDPGEYTAEIYLEGSVQPDAVLPFSVAA